MKRHDAGVFCKKCGKEQGHCPCKGKSALGKALKTLAKVKTGPVVKKVLPRFAVSGYSGKMDGFLYVVAAKNKKEAIRKVADVMKAHYIKIVVAKEFGHENVKHNIIISKEKGEPLDTESWLLEAKKSITDDYQRGEAPRWYHEVWATKLKDITAELINLSDVVVW